MARFQAVSLFCLMGLASIASSCSVRNPSESMVRLHFDFPDQVRRSSRISALESSAALPATLTEFSCLLVNVFGPGIESKNPKFGTNLDKIRQDALGGGSCGYPGIVSQTIIPKDGVFPNTSIELSIPTGVGRVIQVVGLIKATDCLLEMAMKNPAWQENPQGNYYSIGQVSADILSDVTLSLKDDYSAATETGKSNRRVDCYNTDANDALGAVQLTSPNGGEFIRDSVVTRIEWTSQQTATGSLAKLEYSRDNGATWIQIVAGLTNTGSNSYDWTPLTTLGNYAQSLVRVTVTDANGGSPVVDQSDAIFFFFFTNPTVNLSGITASQVIPAGTAVNLTWTATDNMQLATQPIKLEYFNPSTTTWILIADQEVNDGAYTWTAPMSTLVGARIRLSAKDQAGNVGYQESSTFTINNHQTVVNVTSPATGAYVSSASSRSITWTISDLPPPGTWTTNVAYTLNGGTSWTTIVSANTGYTQAWTPPAGNSSNVKIRVRVTDGFGIVTEAMSGVFTLDNTPPTITLNAQPPSIMPAEGMFNVAWTATDAGGIKPNTVHLKYYDGTNYISIASGRPAPGNHFWIAPTSPINSPISLYLQVEDRAGNIGEISSSNIVLSDVLFGILSIDAGTNHTCVLMDNGDVRCWGDNGAGQLGHSPAGFPESGVPLFTDSISNFETISAGGNTSSVYAPGIQKFWGSNAQGNFGNGNTTGATTPITVGHLGVTQLDVGNEQTCAVKNDGTAWCVGLNQYGSLGGGVSTTGTYTTPVTVTAANGFTNPTQISVGAKGACAVNNSGGLWCWGQGNQGQLGTNTGLQESAVPVEVNLASVQSVASGDSHSCALRTDQTVYCWGAGSAGQLGQGSTSNSDSPLWVSGIPTNISEIAAGGNQSCALATGGAVYCWGNTVQSPAQVTAPALTHITAGYSHVCGVTAQGRAYCWGAGTQGQLGDGQFTDSTVAVPVKYGTP